MISINALARKLERSPSSISEKKRKLNIEGVRTKVNGVNYCMLNEDEELLITNSYVNPPRTRCRPHRPKKEIGEVVFIV